MYLTNVFLALDKGRSKNIGTKSFVPERPGTKVSNSLAKKCQKIVFFFFLKMDFFLFVPSVLCLIPTQDIADCQNPILVCPVAKFQNLSCPVLSCPGPSGDEMSKSCPVPYHCKIFRLFHSPFLPLCCIGNCKF